MLQSENSWFILQSCTFKSNYNQVCCNDKQLPHIIVSSWFQSLIIAYQFNPVTAMLKEFLVSDSALMHNSKIAQVILIRRSKILKRLSVWSKCLEKLESFLRSGTFQFFCTRHNLQKTIFCIISWKLTSLKIIISYHKYIHSVQKSRQNTI